MHYLDNKVLQAIIHSMFLTRIYVDKLASNLVVTGGVVAPQKDGDVNRNI